MTAVHECSSCGHVIGVHDPECLATSTGTINGKQCKCEAWN